MGAERILLWRHGRTTWNVERRFQGQTDVPLDALGQRQAEFSAAALAEMLAGEKVRMIASDLSRAHVTAQALAPRLGVQIETDVRLRETAGGLWEGLTVEELQDRFPEEYGVWLKGKDLPPPCGESRDEVAARTSAAVLEAAAEMDSGTLVAVAHGGCLKGGMLRILGLDLPQAYSGVTVLGNTRWSVLTWSYGHWRLESHNVGVDLPTDPPEADLESGVPGTVDSASRRGEVL